MGMYIAVVLLIGAEALLFFFRRGGALLYFLRKLNLLAFLRTDSVFRAYENLNLFGTPVAYRVLFLSFVLGGDNNVVDNGEGDIVLTDLNNFVMPFIRYQIGDRARICSSSNKCSCGRNLQQIDEILGRKFDILTFTNGKSVGGTFWTLLLRSVPGIMDFQVVQEERDVLRINYIADGILSDQDQQKLIEQIKKYCGNNVVTVFDAITKLPVTKAGKRQFVISKVQ